MKIMFFDEQDRVEFTEELKDAAERALGEAAKSEGVDFCVNLLVTDDANIARLNGEFRKIDRPTDVLSFPAYDMGAFLKEGIDGIDGVDIEIEDGSIFIGDIAISLERAAEQAEEYGHGLAREFAFLALHGALHLMGYDHMDEAGEKLMNGKQKELLERAGIGR